MSTFEEQLIQGVADLTETTTDLLDAVNVQKQALDGSVATATEAASATSADVIATNADREQTGLDATATAADREQTGLDRIATGEDRVQTGLDRAAVAADLVQTDLDTVATAADRVQTELDVVATANSASAADISAGLSETAKSAAEAARDASVAAQTAAETSADNAALSATEAASARDAAETARDAAVAVVYSGDASLTPEAGKIPIAGTDGKIDNNWLGIFTPIPGAAAATHYDAETDTGYYGEVTAAELINGTDLAALIGLTAGTAQHSDYGWFKFFVGPRARCNRTAGIASGTITVSDTPVADETLTVGSTTLTFKASRSGAGEIAIDADNAVQAQNIMAAIMEDVTGVRARQIVHTPAVNNAAPIGADPDVVIVTANLAGAEGNAIVLTAAATGIAVSGSGTLAGGVTGTSYTVFVAQRPYRYDLSWNHINAASAVSGATTITINSRDYKIRLLTGGDDDPASYTYGTACSDDAGENSEWSELLYRIHTAAPTCDDINIGMSSSAETRHGGPQRGDNWDTKTDADIVVASGNGRYQWCQEVSGPEASRCVGRGGYGLATFYTLPASYTSTFPGWCPCLEVV